MLDAARKCWKLLPAKLRWSLVAVFVFMHVEALAQLTLVASFFPFLQAMTDPSAAFPEWAGQRLARMDPVDRLYLLGGLVIAAAVAANAVGAVHSLCVARFGTAVNAHLSSRLLRGYLSRPYSFFLTRNSSEFLRTIFSEIDLMTDGFVDSAMLAVSRVLTILALGSLLVAANPAVALGALAVFGGVYAIFYRCLRGRLIRTAEERAEAEDLRFQAVNEAFATIKELKVLHREAGFVEKFERPSRCYFRSLERVQLYAGLPRYAVEAIAFAGMVAVALFLVRSGGGISDALPLLGVFALAGYKLLPAVRGLFNCVSEMRYYRGSVDTIYRECAGDAECGVEAAERGSEVTSVPERLPCRRTIELRQVGFRYSGSRKFALSGLNLRIAARTSVGICGRSGSGKTTLIDLLLGLLEPREGELRVDDVAVGSDLRAAWQANCGYVPQQVQLTDDSIRANIALGIPANEIDDERVRRAARLAAIAPLIEEELPDGYETRVGEHGVTLSGGQRQRIGIARALYHDPDVIVLDEATNALDAETERAVMEAVRSLAGKKTVIAIAHQPSALRTMDRILWMENGKITREERRTEVSPAPSGR